MENGYNAYDAFNIGPPPGYDMLMPKAEMIVQLDFSSVSNQTCSALVHSTEQQIQAMSASSSSHRASERTPLLQDGAEVPSSSHGNADHHAEEEAGKEPQEKSSLSPGSFKFWMLVLSYSSLLFLFSSNATGITTMYFAIAETLQAYQNAATWMTASYMVCPMLANDVAFC